MTVEKLFTVIFCCSKTQKTSLGFVQEKGADYLKGLE